MPKNPFKDGSMMYQIDYFHTERSPKQLTVPMDNGHWKKVKDLGNGKWLGKWEWNNKKQVNGKQ